MDKLMNNHWVMRVIALFMALMLYASVNIDSGTSVKNNSSSPLSFSPEADQTTVTGVPVTTYFDQENLVVTGVPESVEVDLEGATGTLTKASKLRDFEVYADLTKLSTGTHKVKLGIKNLSGDLEANINPNVISVSIEEKVTKDFQVEVDFLNEDKLEEGYEADQPIVNPNSVRVTASKEVIEQISSVKAVVNLEDAEETVNQESRITIYDSAGNELPVEVEPTVVDVTVPIKSPSRVLPFKIVREGELEKGLSISSIEPEPKEITVFGPLDVIEELQFIDGVTVDLSKIKKDTVLEVPIPIPEGVNKVNPEKIKINIDVAEQDEKTFEAQSVKAVGLSEGMDVEMVDPESGTLDVIIFGAPNVIKEINSSDIELYINLSDLSEGEHEVPVEVNGPQNITWSLEQAKVKVKISSAT
ncbi:YbbR-like domain-containing protein YbbR [Bacillus sp. SA1-12]|uniref:CdaR family protein n=1 Tax=Bacillus sp. SA1-12 TaxID=1455638 RepID=UPI000625235F|nr:CdaR family protein [Bacillus sp. SA1-12]KKI92253.1 YbbR-like domain-containing protein YbbR [Bacillus sp. SA1-12]